MSIEKLAAVGVDLEADRPARVDADVGRESLNRGIAGARDVPFGLWISRQRVFTRDGIQTLRAQSAFEPDHSKQQEDAEHEELEETGE